MQSEMNHDRSQPCENPAVPLGRRGRVSPAENSQRTLLCVGVLILVHTSMLAWGALRQGITLDETAHLPAGMSHWHFGRFDLFNVNPPLVRMVAALPVLVSDVQTDWRRYREGPPNRSEFQVAIRFIEVNGGRSFWHFTLGRWACIPFSLLGGYICLCWARELYGDLAGVLALGLWCFSPNIIAHAQLVTPDAGATALGLAAAYCFWRWLRRPRWPSAFGAGIALAKTSHHTTLSSARFV